MRVRIKGRDAAGTEHDEELHWDIADGHPLPVPKDQATAPLSKELRSILVDGARRAGFLDYRIMLRTHLLSHPLPRLNRGPKLHDIIYAAESDGLGAQLFDLASLVILAGVRSDIAGGGQATIGALMRMVWESRPPARYEYHLKYANSHANAFSQAFNAKLPELEARLSEFLSYFESHELVVKFQQVSLAWDKATLKLKGAELNPEITFRGQPVIDHHQFLNEARLSALATCLFLAGVHLSDNDYSNPAYPRFLVLDDTLIGLDLQNRLPVLRILTSGTFKNYQILLFTHDRVWFDLARGHLPEKSGWLHRELIADEDTGRLIPRQKSSLSDLETARNHLQSGDLKAAAVYARSAFEWKLRSVCKGHGIKVPFNPDADKVGAGVLWDGIVQRQRDREDERKMGSQVPDFLPQALESSVETMRSTVLNKLSHAGASGLVHSEVSTAIATVERVCKHDFPSTKK